MNAEITPDLQGMLIESVRSLLPLSYTTELRIELQRKDVREYLEWISRTDHQLEDQEAPLRIKPVNRVMVQFPVW